MLQALAIQAIGFLGVVCFIISFQIKSNKALFFMQMTGSAMFCIQFFFLGAINGCFNLIVLIVRNALLMKINDWKWVAWKGWVVIFIGIYLVVLIFVWQNVFSLLSFAAAVGGTIGGWTNNAQKIRLANLVCVSPAWLIYDISIGSWAGVLNEAIVLGSILFSIYRYGWKAMGDPDSEFQKSNKFPKNDKFPL